MLHLFLSRKKKKKKTENREGKYSFRKQLSMVPGLRGLGHEGTGENKPENRCTSYFSLPVIKFLNRNNFQTSFLTWEKYVRQEQLLLVEVRSLRCPVLPQHYRKQREAE